MDQEQKTQIAKIVCFGVAGYFVYQILLKLMPYVAFFLVLIVAGKLYLDSQNKWRR